MKQIKLNGIWDLKARNVAENNYSVKKGSKFTMNIPGSVQDTLIEKHIVPDPYVEKNELETMFIGKSDWSISRKFNLEKTDSKYVLKLEKVDTIAVLYINGFEVKHFDNEHQIHFIDVTDYVKNGSNDIAFEFTASEKVAIERNRKLKYPIPCSRYKNDSPNRNLVRKTQCNAAWDWGLCLQTIGIYEDVVLYECENYVLQAFSVLPTLNNGVWTLKTEAFITAYKKCEVSVDLTVAGCSAGKKATLKKGENRVVFNCFVPEDSVEKWWPNGYGEQPLYKAELSVEDFKLSRMIGFRTIKVKNERTMGGKELTVCVNGVDVFCKGANWIPLDARPLRMTAKRFDEIMLSVKEANMNMLRVWGGGWYEKEEFYNACDKYGILLWHDLMFSCSTYPTDKWFLESVEKELKDQMHRLKSRTCIALWCGNNECLGALGWYEETISHLKRYLKDYKRLYTNWIDKIMKDEDPDRMYWPSSPCAGPGDYSDNWHSDGNGDMHFWTVWHERKDFEVYHSVKPRFCSEFGYQSFPSLSEVKSFASGRDLNLSSSVMEHHQRNDEGNQIITEMFMRYFRVPVGFENQLYLSQVQQAWAIETAVTFWRSLMPYCTGTLFWQLNDVWPVSSWSSIEYSGKWKALQYAAKRFYSTVSPVLYKEDGKLYFKVANDGKTEAKVSASLMLVNFNGQVVKSLKKKTVVQPLSCFEIKEFKLADLDCENTFVLANVNGLEMSLFLAKPKDSDIQKSGLKIKAVTKTESGFEVNLECNKPAFFVMLDAGSVKGRFEDNFFTLCGEKTVLFRANEKLTLTQFKKALKVYDLYSSSEEKV